MKIEVKNCDMRKIMESGQCFRIEEIESNLYLVPSKDLCCLVKQDGANIWIDCKNEEMTYWLKYFDVKRNYEKLETYFKTSQYEYVSEAVDFGKGLRLLKQDSFETLISYLISSQSTVSRIRKSIKLLCEDLGEKKEYKGRVYYTFPNLRILMTQENLKDKYSLGFHGAYIEKTCKQLFDNDIDVDLLDKEGLKQLTGVGEKVANCVLLSGLGDLEAYPEDVWIKRVNAEFTNGLDIDKYKGILQLYLYYYARQKK